MGKQFEDPKFHWGKTRAEVIEEIKVEALAKQKKEVVHYAMAERIDEAYERWYGREKVYRAEEQIVGDGTMEVPVPAMSILKSEVVYDDEPKNPKELDRHPDKPAIMSSAQKEVQQLIDMQVGVEQTDEQVRKLQQDPTVRILNSRFVHKRKYKISPVDQKEYFDKWKSRLAAQGQHEEPGIDCVWNTFSPTLGLSAIRTLISLMCDPKWMVDSYDLSGAFLGTKLEDREVYLRLPPEAGKYANKVLRLEKSIYGLKSAGKAFMKQLGDEVLKFVERVEYKSPGDNSVHVQNAKFEKLHDDQCMYRYRDELGREMIFASYVDVIICCTTDKGLRERLFDHLRKVWAIECTGTLDRFLGIHFQRSDDGWSWKATMGSYIDKIGQRFGLIGSAPVYTPLDPGFVITEDDIPDQPDPKLMEEFRSLIGSIGYCSTALRYDISYAVSALSRHLARPCKKAVDTARRVIQYLLTTRDFAIEWKSSRQSQQDQTDNVLIGAVDASFAMDTHTRRSHGGYINFVNDGAVSWKSGLQSIVTLSSCEAEYIALCSEVCEVRYLRSLLRSLGFKQRDSTVIWEDNRSTILIAENECSSAGRSKHIDIRYKFVAQTIADNIVRVRYTPTDTNLADILTKALPRATFERLRALCQGNKLGNYYVDATLEHERVMCMCDSNTWMTTSVYSAMVGVI